MSKLSQKGSPRFRIGEAGVIHFLLLFILLAGIIGGVWLVTNGNPLKLFSKAAPVLPSAPETSFELELEKTAVSPFPDEATPQNITNGTNFRVDVYVRADVDAANLFNAKIKYTSDIADFVSIDQRSGQSFVKNWVDASVDNSNQSVGVVNMVGGLPNPGIKTDSQSGALLMGSIIFKAKAIGTLKVEVADSSAIYSNANNINILTVRKGLIEVLITDIQPSPTPTPTPTSVSGFGKAVKISKPGNSYVLAPSYTGPVGVGGLTVGVWIKPYPESLITTNPFAILGKEIISGQATGYILNVVNKKVEFILAQKSFPTSTPTFVNVTSVTTLEANKWYYIAVIVTDRDLYLNVNGVIEAQKAIGSIYDPLEQKLYIGCVGTKTFPCASQFYGEIDDVVIGQVGGVSPKNPSAPQQPNNNIFAIYHLDGDAKDASGKGLNGQANNIQFIDSTVGGVVPIPTPSPTPIPQLGNGDGNKDGKVDFIDLSILLTDYNKNQGIRTGIDINGDGAINAFDFSLMRNLLIKNGLIKG